MAGTPGCPGGLADDLAPAGPSAVIPGPRGSLPRGPGRLHTGRYRVVYGITDDAVLVWQIARVAAG